MDMTLDDLGNIGEVVGAIGVIITLVYLGIQIGRSTKATRQQSYHNLVTRKSEWLNLLADNEEVAKLWLSGMTGESMNPVESQRFVATMLSLMSHFQDVFLQRRAGIIEDSVWEAEQRLLAAVVNLPGVNDWWREATQYFLPEFVGAVAKVEPIDPVVFDQNQERWTRQRGDA